MRIKCWCSTRGSKAAPEHHQATAGLHCRQSILFAKCFNLPPSNILLIHCSKRFLLCFIAAWNRLSKLLWLIYMALSILDVIGSVVMWVLEFGYGALQDLLSFAVQTETLMPAAAMSCCRFSAVTQGLFLTTCHLFPEEAGRTFRAFAVFSNPFPCLNKTVIYPLNLMDSSLGVTISATYKET